MHLECKKSFFYILKQYGYGKLLFESVGSLKCFNVFFCLFFFLLQILTKAAFIWSKVHLKKLLCEILLFFFNYSNFLIILIFILNVV